MNEYADLLHVHPNYLNDVVKEITGYPANHFVQKQLIQEAKSRLIQTSDTVSMIATELQFWMILILDRFLKTNRTDPLQYRKKT